MIDGLITRRLSRKLLGMTIIFVMLAEIVIFIPSAAVFRQDWLEDRAERAGHLTLALSSVPGYEGSEMLSNQFMKDTDVLMLATKREGMTELLLGSPPEGGNIETIDLRTARSLPSFSQTFRSFFGSKDGYLRILAEPLIKEQDVLEYIVPKSSLQKALTEYCHRVLLLSLLIALITGALLYLTLSAMIVRPIQILAKDLIAFRQDPETRRSNLPPTKRPDEIGQLQREFYDMKQSVRASFKQQDRLASLGLAVAKINHDLRNVLTSAQLVSDRIAMDKDERVAHMGQRLVRAVDRGVKLCTDVLNFTQTGDDPAELEYVKISFLVGEAAGDTLSNFGTGPRQINFVNNIPSDMTLNLDPDHTYRIFHNLLRNAGQAIATLKDDDAKRDITINVRSTDTHVEIDVSDSGPGLPEKARNNLFKAFVSSSGHGSTGLGLTISQELAKAQGGNLYLSQTDETGTTFTVTFPKLDS